MDRMTKDRLGATLLKGRRVTKCQATTAAYAEVADALAKGPSCVCTTRVYKGRDEASVVYAVILSGPGPDTAKPAALCAALSKRGYALHLFEYHQDKCTWIAAFVKGAVC